MMKKVVRTISMLALFVLPATLLFSSRAFADSISINLTDPVQSGTARSTVSFSATVTAPDTNKGTVFLNGDSFDVTTPLVLNDSGFQGSPLSLDPGDSFSGELFSFALPSDLPTGQYIGSFEILGGADGGAQDTLGTVNFQVDVAPTVSAVPEPESLMMLAAGLPGVAVLVQRKWRQTSGNRG
jgi:hypothetical protein